MLTQQVLGHEADHMIYALHNHKGKNITPLPSSEIKTDK